MQFVLILALLLAVQSADAKHKPVATHYLMLDSGSHLTMNLGGLLLCNKC